MIVLFVGLFCLLEGSVLLYVLESAVYLAGLHRSHCIMRNKKSCKTIICVQADMLQKPGQEEKVFLF